MKRFRTLACLSIMAVMAMGGAMAQDKTTNDERPKRFEFSLHLGLRNIPVGPLADNLVMELDDYMPMRYKPGSRYSGGALRGLHFNFGMKLKYNLPNYEGWGIIATLDYFAIANATDVIGNETYIAYSTPRRYINIPLMVGVNHSMRVNNKLSLWSEAAIGLNHRMVWNRTINIGTRIDDGKYQAKWTPADEDAGLNLCYTYKETYDNALPVAFQIGSGIKWKRWSLGLHYYNLGWALVEGRYSVQSADSYTSHCETIVADQPFNHGVLKTSLFVLRMGIHF